MGIIRWLFAKEKEGMYIQLPTMMVYALETMTYIQNNARDDSEEEITKDDIVALALAHYMQNNLYANVIDNVDVYTKVNKKDVGFSVSRDGSVRGK